VNAEDLCYTPAAELRTLLERRTVSVQDLVGGVLDRVSTLNGPLNAIVAQRAEAAMAEAAAADQGRPKPRPPLWGIPCTVKDLTETADLPTTFGSRAFAGHQAGFDAEIVRRIRRAGGIIVGKTNTPEFGLRPTTENLLYGPTSNPWNLAHNPGGSSGGSAAAVAAGMGQLSQGTDGGGSIRNPASCCRLVGLKPTRGRVPAAPASYEVWAGLSTDGPIARTVRDVALLLDVIAGPVVGEPYGLPAPSTSFESACDQPPSSLRIAFTVTPPHGDVHPDVAEVVRRAAGVLEEMGHQVTEAAPDLSGLRDAFKTIIAGNAPTLVDGMEPARLPELEPSTLSLLLHGQTVCAADYCRAVNLIRQRGAEIMGFWQEYDVLLTPAMARLPPPLGSMPSAYDVETIWREISDLGAFTYPFNLTGQPGISLPGGWSREGGLPVGIQLVGAYGDEAGILSLAAIYEQARPWSAERPRFDSAGAAQMSPGEAP
jgi:amidase